MKGERKEALIEPNAKYTAKAAYPLSSHTVSVQHTVLTLILLLPGGYGVHDRPAGVNLASIFLPFYHALDVLASPLSFSPAIGDDWS